MGNRGKIRIWYYKLTDSFLQTHVIIPTTVRQANGKLALTQIVTRVTAMDHQLSYYYYIAMDELLNPETGERLVLVLCLCMIPVRYHRLPILYRLYGGMRIVQSGVSF